MLDNPVSKKMREAQRLARYAQTLEESGVSVNGEELSSLLDELYEQALKELNQFFAQPLK